MDQDGPLNEGQEVVRAAPRSIPRFENRRQSPNRLAIYHASFSDPCELELLTANKF